MKTTTIIGFLCALLFTSTAHAEKVLGVARVDVSGADGQIDARQQTDLTELLRDTAVETLAGSGWVVLADDAKGKKKILLIEGRIRCDDEQFTASLRLMLASAPTILATKTVEGESIGELRAALRQELPELLASVGLGQVDGKAELLKVPLGSDPNVMRGPKTAKVTIVEFADFECPFCSRVKATVDALEKKYGKDLRFVFRHNPLPMHPNAELSAHAAVAAAEQGKFWPFYDKLFANQNALTRGDLEKYAAEVGLNLPKFKAALDSSTPGARVEEDIALARKLLAGGTPHFFINGRRLVGAQPQETFEAIIETELRRADVALALGTKPADLYDEFVARGQEAAKPPPTKKPKKVTESAIVIPGDGPSLGPAQAKVTIVGFVDFQCPYCKRAQATLQEALRTYPDVRLVFRHLPLPFHPNAMPAAIAAEAAARQDAFWKFHDLAFERQTSLSRKSYVEWAKELGLDVNRFERDLDDPSLADRVTTDSKYGPKVGANGTPTFFVNGVLVAGAVPFSELKTIIDEQLKKADELLTKGVPREQLYDKLNAANVANVAAVPPKAPSEDLPSASVEIPLGDSPIRGNPNAKVTIVEFGDFQCPFCRLAQPTLAAIQKKYGDQVRIVWKNQPLPFHPRARPAAIAALAAGAQDQFWAMHDKLFAGQKDLSDGKLMEFAEELRLDLKKFAADLESPAFAKQIDDDAAFGKTVDARGTPTFFINGRKFVGAQPLEAFEVVVEEALRGK